MHVKQWVFCHCDLVYKGCCRDIEIPYNFQLASVEELFADIS